MEVIFAKNIGFCFGAKRAIEILNKSLKEDPKPIFVLGKILHNKKVIQDFKKRGAKFVNSLKKINSGTLIISAHGFLPKVLPKNVLIRDATCPLVKKAQILAKSLVNEGLKLIIVGEKNHPETRGIKNYAGGKGKIIEKEIEAKKIKGKKIGLVIQTTQKREKFEKILKILKENKNEIKYFNTLCPEVQKRQQKLKKLLKICDGILIVGSRFSANTKRLYEIAKSSKKKVFWIDSADKLKKMKLSKIKKLGVISGNSVPDSEIEKIKSYFKTIAKTNLNFCF